MKKLIAVVLSIIMLFSLCACGGDTMTSSLVSVNIKGNGKKTMKVSMADQLQDVEYELEYYVDDSEEPVYQVAVTKEEAHAQKYSITGLNPGESSWTVRYMTEGKMLAQISMDITVNEALHVFYSNFNFASVTTSEGIELLDADGNPLQMYVTVEESGVKFIQLENNGGWWEIGVHDESVVRIAQKDIEDEDTSSIFMIEAIGAGASMTYFINPDIDTQVVFDIATEEKEDGGYRLIINGYTTGPIDHFTTDENQLLLQEVEKEFGETIIPDDSFVKGVGYNTGDDFATVQFMMDRTLAEYTIIRGETAQQLIEYMTSEIEAEENIEMKLGTHDAHYLYFEGGLAVVFWDEEGQAVRMDFSETGKDSGVYKAWLEKFMPPVDETAEKADTATESAVTEKN